MPKILERGKQAIEHIGDDPKSKRVVELSQYDVFSNGKSKDLVKTISGQKMDFVLCPSGSMEKKIHIRHKTRKSKKTFKIEITKPFLIGTTPITQGVWEYVMGYNPSYYQELGIKINMYPYQNKGSYSAHQKEDMQERVIEIKPNLNRPIESITWFDALVFCNKLSELQNLEPYYTINDIVHCKEIEDFRENTRIQKKHKHSKRKHTMPIVDDRHIVHADVSANPNSNGYRLPTLSEWDFIKHITMDVKFESENKDLDSLKDEDFYVKPVASGDPNSLGLYDVNENVFEMLYDHTFSLSNIIEELKLTQDIHESNIFNFLQERMYGDVLKVHNIPKNVLEFMKKIKSFKDPLIEIKGKYKALDYIIVFLTGCANDIHAISEGGVIFHYEDKALYGTPSTMHFKRYFNVGFRVVRNVDINVEPIHTNEKINIVHKKIYKLNSHDNHIRFEYKY